MKQKFIKIIYFTPLVASIIFIIIGMIFYFLIKDIKVEVFQSAEGIYLAESNEVVVPFINTLYDKAVFFDNNGKRVDCIKIKQDNEYITYSIIKLKDYNISEVIKIEIKIKEITYLQRLFGGK